MWFYSTPRIGGHQTLLDKQFCKSPIITEFPLYSIETAQLLQHRNSTFSYMKACSTAAVTMISEFEEATVMK
eukprot:15365611-Ditylum_brightwellii.AAC.1